MRPEEITALRYAGFTEKEIKNFRKVCSGKKILTSDNLAVPDVFTLELPPEARYFFGLAQCANLKNDFTFNLILNNERVIDTCNVQLIRVSRGIAINDGMSIYEYLECGRRLSGRDTLIYNSSYGATVPVSLLWYYVIDITAAPKETQAVHIVPAPK